MSLSADIAFPLRLSLQVATVATLLSALFGVAAAYVLSQVPFRGKSLVDAVLTLPMVLPPVVTGYYLLILLGRNSAIARSLSQNLGIELGITFTWWGAAIAAFVVSVPLTIKTARSAIDSLDPALIDASYLLGRTEIETAWYVVFPLARRGIMAGLVLSFARALGEFGATIMVAGNIPGRTNTMSLEIYNAVVYGDWKTASILVAVFTAVSVALLLLANRLSGVRD